MYLKFGIIATTLCFTSVVNSSKLYHNKYSEDSNSQDSLIDYIEINTGQTKHRSMKESSRDASGTENEITGLDEHTYNEITREYKTGSELQLKRTESASHSKESNSASEYTEELETAEDSESHSAQDSESHPSQYSGSESSEHSLKTLRLKDKILNESNDGHKVKLELKFITMHSDSLSSLPTSKSETSEDGLKISKKTENWNIRSVKNPNEDRCSDLIVPNLSAGCCGVIAGSGELETRSLGGEDTFPKQYPWLVALDFEDESICSAFLISSQYVLTAAHCVETNGEVTKPITVRLGSLTRTGDDIDRAAVEISVDTVIVHPGYNESESLANDIALVKLRNPAPFTDYIRPICLPTNDVTKRTSKKVRFEYVGWGAAGQYHSVREEKYIDIFVNERLRVPLVHVDNTKCQKLYDSLDEGWTITEKQLCAVGASGQSPCRGDSGGPLMYTGNGVSQVVGVYSFGLVEPCGSNTVPGVYTRVYKYTDWIKREIMKQLTKDIEKTLEMV